MFICVLCPEIFTLEDIKAGEYFPSTGVCFSCYKSLAKNSLLCFGDRLKYDLRVLACQQCPDQSICKAFIRHIKRRKYGRRSG